MGYIRQKPRILAILGGATARWWRLSRSKAVNHSNEEIPCPRQPTRLPTPSAAIESGLQGGPKALCRSWWVDTQSALSVWPRCPFRCIAGKATTWADSKRPARMAAGWRSRATTPARPARPMSFAATRSRPSRSFPASTASTCMPVTPRRAASGSIATNCAPSISRAGSIGAKEQGLGMDFNPTYFAHPKAADGMTLAHRRRRHPQVLDRARHRLPQDRRGDRRGPGQALRHQLLDSRRHEGPARRPRRPAAAADRVPRRDLRRARSARPTTSMPSRASFSASARRATSSARTSITWATPSRGRSCSASTRATSIPRKRSSTRSRPSSPSSTRSCCTSAAASAGTATTW